MGKTALPGASRLNAFSMHPDKLVIVGLDTEHQPGEHELWDERIHDPLDEGMVRNIRVRGVLQPIIVRKNGESVEVVDGRQRVRAAREASRRNDAEGLPTIHVPCIVRRSKGRTAAQKAADALDTMISTNENRHDDNPVTRAHKAQRLLDYGRSDDEVAETFGITKQALKNLLVVLDLSPKVQDAIGKSISFTAATTLKDLTHEEQDKKLEELVAAGVSVAEALRLQRARKKKETNGEEHAPRGRAVPVRTLRKVADDKDFMSELSPDARAILQWVLGDENAVRRVKGLTALLYSNEE